MWQNVYIVSGRCFSNPNNFIPNVKNPLDQDVDLQPLADYHYQDSGAQSQKKKKKNGERERRK